MPFTIAQMPANTSNVAARVRKNWPLSQNASPTIRMPLIRLSHHRSLKTRSANAWTVQRIPIIRNTKPEDVGEPGEGRFRMDQGNDCGGGQQHPEQHPYPPAGTLISRTARRNSSAANTRNMIPVSTPTVTTGAWLNFNTTIATMTQNTPNNNSTHQ